MAEAAFLELLSCVLVFASGIIKIMVVNGSPGRRIQDNNCHITITTPLNNLHHASMASTEDDICFPIHHHQKQDSANVIYILKVSIIHLAKTNDSHFLDHMATARKSMLSAIGAGMIEVLCEPVILGNCFNSRLIRKTLEYLPQPLTMFMQCRGIM